MKRVVLLFLIVLLTGQACALPFRLSPEPTAPAASPQTAQPTSTIIPQAKQVLTPSALPASQTPLLAEVIPAPGSDISLTGSLVFYFSTPMDAESVQRGMEILPAVDGRQEWLDNATLRFTPSAALPAATALQITFNDNVRASSGEFIPEPVVLTYRTVDVLRVVEQIPQPDLNDVDPAAAVLATFNRPVIALAGDADSAPPAFTLQPAAEGRGEWINTSTYAFYPDIALEGGQHYEVRMNPDLGAVEGADWSFSTAPPQVRFSVPDGQENTALDAPIRLTFNQPMDAETVTDAFSMQGPEGVLQGVFSWNEDLTEATFLSERPLVRQGDYRLTLTGDARSAGGTNLRQDTSANFQTIPPFAYLGISPDNSAGETLQVFENNYGLVSLLFNAPLDIGQDFAKLITFTPAVPELYASLNEDQTSLSLAGFFQPGIFYVLHLSPEIHDRWGDNLNEPIGLGLRTAAARPAFSIPMLLAGTNLLFVTSADTSIPARATNLTGLEITSGSLNLENFLRLMQDARLEVGVARQRAWQQSLTLPPDVSTPFALDLTGFEERLTPGLYYYKVDSPQLDAETAGLATPFLVVSSDIQLTVKRGAEELFVWAYLLEGRQPAASLAVRVYDGAGVELGSGTTAKDGSLELTLPPGLDVYEPLYAVAGQPGEDNFSLATTAWNQGISGWEFGLPVTVMTDTASAYIYTERPVYRPGQVVHYRLALRERQGGQYFLPEAQSVTVIVTGPGVAPDETFSIEQNLTLSAFGTASADINLPEEAQPGYYSLTVKDRLAQGAGFQVASYRKPEINLQVLFERTEAVAGEDLRATISALYYFGTPAAGLPVTWTLTAVPEAEVLPDGFTSGPLELGWLEPGRLFDDRIVVSSGEGQVAPYGSLDVPVLAETLRSALPPGRPFRLELEAVIQEESGQVVAARDEMVLHPAEFRIGLRPERYGLNAGDPANFDVRCIDLAGQPAGERRLRALFQKVTWERGKTPDPLTGFTQLTPRFSAAGSTDFVTDANGRARLSFNPQETGTFALEVSGEGASSAVLLWVGGAGTATWPELPNQRLELTSEQSSYSPGETAQIFVPNPFREGALAVITIERENVLRWVVQPVQAGGEQVNLPLESGDAPNVYLAVLLMGEADAGVPDFRQGYLQLAVQPDAHLLNVELTTTPTDAQPGDEAEITIRAWDVDNRPVEAEFSLAVVDQAVLALADGSDAGISQAFYGLKPLGVSTGMSLAAYAGRITLIQPGRGGGGGASAPVDIREEFADTAFWSGSVVTGADGTAQVRVTLPDNLTTWVVDARGISRSTQVGEAQTTITASKPLLIRPSTPRFLVTGDHAELSAQVHNNTDEALNVQVRLDAAGVVLDDPTKAEQFVLVEPGRRAGVTWWVTAQAAAEADLIFSAKTADYQDVTRPQAGKLPILRYQSAQVFATGGVLPEAGQRSEYISLPRTYTPLGGELRLELSASLAGGIVSGLEQLQPAQVEHPEAAISALLPALEAYRALQALGADTLVMETRVQEITSTSLSRLRETQHADGGWGWGESSDPWMSAYILFGLARARQAGAGTTAGMEAAAQRYVSTQIRLPDANPSTGQLDRLVWMAFALHESGAEINPADLKPYASELSAWAQGLLAVMLEQAAPGDAVARTIEQQLRQTAVRGATGAHWDAGADGRYNNASITFTSAAVVYALARLNPADPLLPDALRYLVSMRQPDGLWANSYETAWALLALTEALRGTGDLSSSFDFFATLNGVELYSAGGADNSPLTPVMLRTPLENLRVDGANRLVIERGTGSGRLYYRTWLEINRPVESAPAVEQGMSLTRSYHLTDGSQIESVSMAGGSPVVLVRLTLTLPRDASNVVVKDTIPAGAEVLDLSLNTGQQSSAEVISLPEYDATDPFGAGWRWWLFGQPRIRDTGIDWFAETLPAGVYQLTYRLVVTRPGEYRLIPAQAYETYFPETRASSPGGILSIQP